MTSFAAKGSQRWLQVAVNCAPHLLEEEIRKSARLPIETKLHWLSPLATENFIEYRDGATFQKLGVHFNKRSLECFWPVHGPCWDGLAKADSNDVFLLEAKAHIGEMVSGRSGAKGKSKELISESLKAVQRAIAPGSDEIDWTGKFYQYANRLAYLYFMRIENNIPAHLIFVYFLNDTEMGGPKTKEEYEAASTIVERYLGIRRSKLTPYIHKIYLDVNDLKLLVES
jgi:hypothetical protein